MKPKVKFWTELDSEKFGCIDVYLACYDYEDYPEVHEIKIPVNEGEGYIYLHDGINFDPDDFITDDDWGTLLDVNRQAIVEYEIDMADAAADAAYDEWKDRRWEN